MQLLVLRCVSGASWCSLPHFGALAVVTAPGPVPAPRSPLHCCAAHGSQLSGSHDPSGPQQGTQCELLCLHAERQISVVCMILCVDMW